MSNPGENMSRASSIAPTAASLEPDSTQKLPGERLSEDAGDREDVSGDSEESSTSNGDTLWVDWEGPNDPLNPKKYVLGELVDQCGR